MSLGSVLRAKNASLTAILLTLAVVCMPLVAGETFFSKPSAEWTEQEALQVLADSPWAHTFTPSTQDTPCSYKNPAFEGLLSRAKIAHMAAISTLPDAITPKPDAAKYVVRLTSAKPVQAAAERLLQLDEKWAPYLGGGVVLNHERPTNIPERFYNIADSITVAVVLKEPASDGSSFLDYAFQERNAFPAHGIFLTPCAALRTSNGQVTWLLANIVLTGPNISGIFLSFPSMIDGKPLVSHPNEEVEFRFIANQRVFDATFTLDPADMLDGTEKILRVPSSLPDQPPPTP